MRAAIMAALILASTAGANPMLDALFMARGRDTGIEGFRVTFLTGTFPTNIVLGAAYTGPATPAAALYDAGDGNWVAYTSNTIARVGDYVAFKGDWRTSGGIYYAMFHATFQSAAYTCKFSGGLTHVPTVNRSAFKSTFMDCNAVVAIEHNPLPIPTGGDTRDIFLQTYYNMSGVTGPLPAGFMDTSQLTGAPGVNAFYRACRGMSGVTGPLPAGFMDTSGMAGNAGAQPFREACHNMSGVTGPLPSGFMNTSQLTGAPNVNMFADACYNMSGVTGPLPAGFMDTSGLTGELAVGIFYQACYNMSGVTGSLPAGFMDTSGLTGGNVPATFFSACYNMSSISGGVNINMGSNITWTSANVVGSLSSAFRNMPGWTGEVMWGTNVLALAITPDSQINTFTGSTNMPNYSVIDGNWKGE